MTEEVPGGMERWMRGFSRIGMGVGRALQGLMLRRFVNGGRRRKVLLKVQGVICGKTGKREIEAIALGGIEIKTQGIEGICISRTEKGPTRTIGDDRAPIPARDHLPLDERGDGNEGETAGTGGRGVLLHIIVDTTTSVAD